MDSALPFALAESLERLSDGHSGRDLAMRAQAISALYRSGAPSSQAIQGPADALAYALTRMPATYAAVGAAIQALAERAPSFSPLTVVDIGCGPGTASWAALEAFSPRTLMLFDANRALLDLATVLLKDTSATLATRLGDLTSAVIPPSELVVAAYVLTEMAQASAMELAGRLWTACEAVLLIVEPGTPAGWARLMAIRTALIGKGAKIVSPCPHESGCPLTAPDWCHFARRLPRSRAHRLLKGADAPFEDEKYAYLALARSTVRLEFPGARVLSPPLEEKAAISFKLCEPSGALTLRRVPRRDKAALRAIRRAGWGDEVDA